VPEQRSTRSASRYDAVIATLVGFCALCVSGYTAYMQRQQVRAMVWPILEFVSSNDPNIHLSLANKGVGPAIIRHVTVRVDNQPVSDWVEGLERLMGAGEARRVDTIECDTGVSLFRERHEWSRAFRG